MDNNLKQEDLQARIAAKKAEVGSKGETDSAVATNEIKETQAAKVNKPKKVAIFNTLGKEVDASDYFYKGVIPSGFLGTCGSPVDREDLLGVFNKVFKPSDNILFYKQNDKEVYLVIVPLKYSTSVGESEDSLDGDFQKHAISFLNEGSVNLDTMRVKLEKVTNFVKYSDR